MGEQSRNHGRDGDATHGLKAGGEASEVGLEREAWEGNVVSERCTQDGIRATRTGRQPTC